jgi:hypothetical protein
MQLLNNRPSETRRSAAEVSKVTLVSNFNKASFFKSNFDKAYNDIFVKKYFNYNAER